jgi:hypothetical protein
MEIKIAAEEYRMNRRFYTVLGVAMTSLWSIANATTVTYNFSGTTQNVGSTGVVQSGGGGMFFATSSQSFGSPSIAVYGETTTQTGDGGPGKFTGTTGLFEVTNGSGGNTATGIGPYDNMGGTSPSLNFQLQPGISSSQAVDGSGASPSDQLLLLNLSNLTAGSTVSFVMATGANAGAAGVNVWTGTPTGTPLGVGTGWSGQTASNTLATESIAGGAVNGSGGAATQSFTLFTNNLPSNEWIAIQADCHYLLLQSITVTSPSGVPEPSFYGFFALGMVAMVIGARKLRARPVAVKA